MIVPLFPLANAVLFPKTPLPLHIFEKRYRTMIRESLAGSRQLVIALMRSEPDPKEGRPGLASVHAVACLGKIESYEELDDGKYDIVVVGTHRVRFIRQVRHSPYRLVEVVKLEDAILDEQSTEIIRRHNHLVSLFTRFMELAAGAQRDFMEFLPRMDFESLVNTAAMTLHLPALEKQALLEIGDASWRCDRLLPFLQRQIETLALVRKFEHLKPESPHWN